MSSGNQWPFCLSLNVLLVNSLRSSDAYMRWWSNHHWFRKWLVAWSTPSHYLNQCWNIVNWTPRNKLQWNINQNSYIFIQENPFANVIWKMAAILSQPQCVKDNGCVQLSSWNHHLLFSAMIISQAFFVIYVLEIKLARYTWLHIFLCNFLIAYNQ